MKILRALLLVSTLSVCVYAGEMDNGRTSPPPPPSVALSIMTQPNVDEPAKYQGTEPDITEAVLSLLQSVLFIF